MRTLCIWQQQNDQVKLFYFYTKITLASLQFNSRSKIEKNIVLDLDYAD